MILFNFNVSVCVSIPCYLFSLLSLSCFSVPHFNYVQIKTTHKHLTKYYAIEADDLSVQSVHNASKYKIKTVIQFYSCKMKSLRRLINRSEKNAKISHRVSGVAMKKRINDTLPMVAKYITYDFVLSFLISIMVCIMEGSLYCLTLCWLLVQPHKKAKLNFAFGDEEKHIRITRIDLNPVQYSVVHSVAFGIICVFYLLPLYAHRNALKNQILFSLRLFTFAINKSHSHNDNFYFRKWFMLHTSLFE